MRPGLVLALATGLALTAGSAGAYRTGAPAGHTGGFGEPTCETCHSPGAERAGSVTLEVPDRVRAGASQELRVILQDPELRSGGFQLSARFSDGPKRGQQAGTFVEGPGLRVVEGAAGVQYIGHTEAGVRQAQGQAGDRVAWPVRWTAPGSGDAVTFHLAANAANDDDSEFGDRVYTTGRQVRIEPAEHPKQGSAPDSALLGRGRCAVDTVDLPQVYGLRALPDLLRPDVEHLHEQ